MADPVAPVATPEPAPAITPTPVAVAAPLASPEVVVAPAADITPAAVEPPKPAETVLGEAMDKPAEPVVAEPAPGEVPKPAEGEVTPDGEPKAPESLSDEPAPLPTYDAFTLPDGVTVDEGRLKEFTSLLGDLESTGKADHAAVQQFGQKAVDFHVAELTKAQENLTKFYQTSWEKQKTDWKDQFLADPEIGGNRFQTSIDSALNFIRSHGGSEAQQTEFRALMESSGIGNHPAMIRLLAKAGMAMSEGKPLAASTPPPQAKSRTQTMYGKP